MVQTSWSLMIEDFFNIMHVCLLSISLLTLHYQIIAAPACLIVWFLFLQINARATYGLSFGGTSPDIFSLDRNSSSTRKIVGNNFDEHHSNISHWPYPQCGYFRRTKAATTLWVALHQSFELW